MATISRRLSDGRWQVTLAGHLGAGDLLRLERACAPALDQRLLPLDLQVEHITGVDQAARLFLRQLQERGAVLIRRSGEAACEDLPGTENPGPD